MPLDVNTFAEKIKTKYPQYKDVDNLELAKKIVEKYPQYKEQVTFEEVKKKETTESSLEDGSSVMPKAETQKPSESSSSKQKIEGDLYSGYPGKEAKKYRYDEASNSWYEYSHTDASDKGNIDRYEKPISNVSRVNSLNKYFGKQASTSDVTQVFTGYPGKEKNEYTIIDGRWHRRMPGKSEFSEIKNVGSIQALNREFGQDVAASKYRDAVTDEVGQRKQQEKEQLDVKLNSVDGNLVDLEEEEAVTKLKQLFPDFKFEESGALTDNVKITAPGGVDEITLPFDNFFSSADSDVAKQLKSFLNTYSNKDLVEKMAKEQEVRDRQQKSILPTDIDLQTEGRDLTKDIKELEIIAKEGLPEKQMPDPYLYTKITKEELDPAQKEMLESYNNAFIKLSLDKNTTASDLAALPKNKSVVKSIETANRLLEDKMGKYSSDLDEFNTLVDSGEIDEETFDLKKAEFEKRREEIKDEVRMSTVGSKALSQAVTNNSLIREEQGNFVSGMSRNFISGLTSIGRITGMSAEEHQQLLDDIVGVGTTKDYIQSANRSDLVQAMFSISESIGVATPALLTGGGSLVTGAGFFTQSFYEMKDELDEVEELNGSDKFLMASAYGLVSAALENFGLGVALNKTRVGNKLTKNVMSSFLKALPKNATPQAIKATLNKTIGEFSSDLLTRGLKSSIAEGSTEALQYLSNVKIKEIYDSAKDKNLFDDSNWVEETWRNFYIGALAGGITSATNTSMEYARKFGIDKLENKQMATLMRELREPQALKEKKNFVNEQLKHGLITQEEAKATIEKYDAIHNALNTLPENIKPKVAKEALGLIAERKKLEKEIEGKEETLVVAQKERIKEINDKLTELGKTKEDAVQEQTTDEGVLRQEESEVGLQEVEQRDQEQEVVAEEEVIIPEEELASLLEGTPTAEEQVQVLTQEVERKQDEGPIDMNLGETAYMGDTPGTIKIDPQNENTVVFETEDKIIELGNVNEIAESDIVSFGLSLSPETKADVDQSGIVTYEGKKYKVLGRRRDKKGQSVVRVKDIETGLERRIKGPEAENILKDQALAKKKQEPKLKLTTEGKEVVVDKQKVKDERRAERAKAKQEFEAKSLQEIEQAQKQAEKDIADFEAMALVQVSKKPKTKDLVQVGEKVFQVTEKSDGTFTVSQMREDGKLVAIKDDKSKKKAIDKFKKERTAEEKAKLEEAQKLVDDFKKTQEDKVLALLDKAIAATSSKGRAFDASLGIPVFIANTSLKIVKASYVAGKTLAEAVKDGYDYVVKNGYRGTEFEYKKFVSENINEQKKTKQAKSPSPKKILGDKDKKVTVNERTALRDQIKYGQKIAREIAKNTKEGQEAARAHINERLKKSKATFSRVQFERAMKRAMKTRFYDAHDVARLNEYIDKTAKKAENFDKIKSALSLKSKIRKRLKNNQKDTKIAAKKFGAIDPIMVEDIDKYIAIAEKVYNAVKPTILGAKRQDYKTATELDEVMAYAEAEIARQDEIRKQNLLASDKGQLLIMDGVISEDMSLKEIQDAMKEKSEELDEDFMQEIKDITSDMQDRVKEMEDISEDISDMANMDLESLSKKELVTLYEYLDNFLVNQTEDGTALFNRFIKGKNNAARAAKSGLRFKTINKISRTYRMLLSNQESLLDRLLGSSSKSELFKSLSGLLDFDKAKYAAQKLHDSILKEYDSKFSKVKDFKSTKNIFERGIYAYLSRNSDVDFEARKQNVLDTIENLKNSKREHEIELAEKYEKDITRMGVRDAKSLSDLNVAEHNKQAVEFWQEKWAEHYGDLKYIASTIYNKDLNEDQNYTPDFYKKLDIDEKTAEQLMDAGNFGDLSKISTEMPGVLMDAKTPNGLKNMYVDFDFDHNIASQMESALKSIYADKHVATVKSFLESKEFSELFEDNNLRDVVKWMLDDYVNRSMKRSSQRSMDSTIRRIQSLDKKTTAVFKMLGLAGTAQALASVTQFAKNTIPIIANTYVNLGKNARYLDFVLNKGERDFIDNLDYPISIRGKEAVTGLYKEMGYEKADTPKRVRAVNKMSEKALQATIGISDKYVARVSWMAYYKANLAEQGVKVGEIDWSTHKVNDKAASYAQSMVDRQQNISDVDKRSVIDRTSFSTIANVIQPFSSFILSAKMRMRNDVNTLIRANRSGDISKKETREATLSLVGTLVEIATFQAISLGVSETYSLVARALTGEPEDDKDKDLSVKLTKRIISQTFLDAVSPTPMADEFTSLIFNLLSDGVNNVITSDKKVNEYIRVKQNEEYEKHASDLNIYKYTFTELEKKELREKYLEENKFNINIYKNDSELLSSLKYLGKTAIPIGKIADVVESISLKSKKELKDDLFGNKKYIPDEAEYLLNEAMALSVLGLISPDASAIGRRITRTIKRYALTKSQYERYSVAKSYAPGSISLEDLYLIKNTNLTPSEIANYAIENQGKDKIKIYRRYKKEGVF